MSISGYQTDILTVRLGDHVCCLYETDEERRSVLVPYLSQGLLQKEQVICVLPDAAAVETVVGYLADAGVQTEPLVASGSLQFFTAEYLKGLFQNLGPEDMNRLWRDEVRKASAAGYKGVRVAGEMTWTQSVWPSPDTLVEYEAGIGEWLDEVPLLGLCLYDRRRFAPGVLLRIMEAHAKVCLSDTLCDNLYHVPYRIARDGNHATATLNTWIQNLVDRQQMAGRKESGHADSCPRPGERAAESSDNDGPPGTRAGPVGETLCRGSDTRESEECPLDQAQMDAGLLDSILAASADHVFLFDRTGQCIYASRSIARGLGIDEKRFLGYGWKHLGLLGHVVREFAERIDSVLATGEPATGEIQFFGSSGRVFEYIFSPLPGGLGVSVESVVATAREVTKRKQAEDALKLLTEILEETSDFVATSDVDGNTLYYNRAFRKALGIGETEDTSERTIPDNHPEWAASIILSEGRETAIRYGIWSGETAVLSCDGREIPVSQVIIAHRTPQGAIRNLSTIMRDLTERKLFEAQLLHLASHDPLTNLFNRRRFQEEINRELAHARRYGNSGALLFLDLNDFKDINDTIGHLAGDRFLVSFAALLRDRLRETDIVARIGGDEFAVFLPRTDLDQAQVVADHILSQASSHRVIVDGRSVSVTVSIGIAMFPQHGSTIDELVIHADEAMYRVKECKCNLFGIYSTD